MGTGKMAVLHTMVVQVCDNSWGGRRPTEQQRQAPFLNAMHSLPLSVHAGSAPLAPQHAAAISPNTQATRGTFMLG
jgi:hypothetical protein